MELQFHKSRCACLQCLTRQVQEQEQTQEVRISDGMPDIGKVLGAWGQVLIRSKEWRSGSMHVAGGVMAWVLYAPEEGGQSQCVEAWIPFQMKWDTPDTDRDGTICVNCLLRGMDARSISARKLMVRANVGVMGEAYLPWQTDVCCPQEVPEDVQILKNTYPLRLPKEAGEKPFALEEELILPGGNPKLEKLIHYRLQPEIIDEKVMAGKVVFRGAVIVHILYRSEDGQLCNWDFEIPFSQFSELDNDYGQDACAKVIPAVTALELDAGEEGKLILKAGITGQYVIYDRELVEVAEDAYSPRRSVKIKTDVLQLPVVLDTQQQTVHAEQSVQIPAVKAVDVVFYPHHPRLNREDSQVQIELPGHFQMLYYDEDGMLQSEQTRWEGKWSLGAEEDVQVDASVVPTGKPQAAIAPGGTDLRSDLLASAVTIARQGIPMVTSLELGELTDPDPNRPSLILRKTGEDRLWDVAKRSGSTVEAIKEVNGLTDEPAGEQMLLIPIF